MGLENLKIENNETLDAILAEMESFQIEIETNSSQQENAKEIIQSLDEIKLSKYIEKSFKNDDNEWLTYSDMKNNKFYPFMVQSCIDLLGNKLGNKKYDENGNEISEEGEGGKTLDEYMTSIGGIDNIYGNGTKQAVELIQKILGIHVDGLAGPQFFAKVCSVLKKEQTISNFKVKGFDGEHPYKYGFENFDNNTLGGWTKTSETRNGATVYNIDDLGNLAGKSYFPKNSCAVYKKDNEEYTFYSNGRIFDITNQKMGNWNLKNGKVEVVRDVDKNKTVVLKYPEITSQKAITNIEDIPSIIPFNEKYTITNAAGEVQYEIFSDRAVFHDGSNQKTGVRKKLDSTNGVIISYEDNTVEYSQKDKLSENIPDKQLFISILDALGSDKSNTYGFNNGILTKGKGRPRYYTNKGRLIQSVNRNLPYNNFYVREDSESEFVEAGEYKTNPSAPGGSYVIHDKYKSIV